MVALQMSPKIESLYGLGRQAKKNYKFKVCMEFFNFCKAPFSFSNISVEIFRFSM